MEQNRARVKAADGGIVTVELTKGPNFDGAIIYEFVGWVQTPNTMREESRTSHGSNFGRPSSADILVLKSRDATLALQPVHYAICLVVYLVVYLLTVKDSCMEPLSQTLTLLQFDSFKETGSKHQISRSIQAKKRQSTMHLLTYAEVLMSHDSLCSCGPVCLQI